MGWIEENGVRSYRWEVGEEFEYDVSSPEGRAQLFSEFSVQSTREQDALIDAFIALNVATFTVAGDAVPDPLRNGIGTASVGFDYAGFNIRGSSDVDRLGGINGGWISDINVTVPLTFADLEITVGIEFDRDANQRNYVKVGGQFVELIGGQSMGASVVKYLRDTGGYTDDVLAAIENAVNGVRNAQIPAMQLLIRELNEQFDINEMVDGAYDAIAKLRNLSGGPNNDWPWRPESRCFLGGTSIKLFDGNSKPIEKIIEGDVVLSYDHNGTHVPGRVTRAFQSHVTHLLDIHGLHVTPGHVTLCGDGMFKGRHVPIIDILLSDGALVTAEGALVRIATHAPVGSLADAFVKVAAAQTPEDVSADRLSEGEMRVGTLLFDRDGGAVSVLDCLNAEGYAFDPDTGLVAKPGEVPHPLHWFGPIPRPEDYVLRRSRETLAGIVTGGEWEGSPSVLIAARLQHTLGRVH
jgi:hypothetical protein